MLPDFVVIGAFKAGSTSLHHYFDQHPSVFMTRMKDPTFFAYDPKSKIHAERSYLKTLVSDRAEYEALFDEALDDQKKGEVSPAYLHSSLAPQRMKELVPRIKIIGCLRNPVDRAYSHYQMILRSGGEKKSIETAFSENAFWVKTSMYANEIERYQRLFSNEQLKFVLFDDLTANPQALMSELFAFISVDPTFMVNIDYKFNPGGVPKFPWVHTGLNALKQIPGLRKFTPPFIRNSLARIRDKNLEPMGKLDVKIKKQWLEYYQSDILRVQDLLQVDLSRWLTFKN